MALSEVWGIHFHYLNMTLALWGLLRYCLVILLTIENHCLPPSSSHTYIAFLIFKFIKLSNRDVAPIFTPTVCWEKPLYNKVYKRSTRCIFTNIYIQCVASGLQERKGTTLVLISGGGPHPTSACDQIKIYSTFHYGESHETRILYQPPQD